MPTVTRPGPYQLFMLVLSVYVLATLVVRAMVDLPEEMDRVIWLVDTGLCVLFFGDFLRSLIKAESKWRYFVTWGWLDLLSSVPVVDSLRWARLARVARLIQILRRVHGFREMVRELVRRRGETTFYSVFMVSLGVVLLGSISVLNFEHGVEGSLIQSPGDALWWTLVTMSTVGYGDFYPLTLGGRVVAVVLMMSGIGLFGTFTGILATWFAGKDEAESMRELTELRREVVALRELIEQRLPGE